MPDRCLPTDHERAKINGLASHRMPIMFALPTVLIGAISAITSHGNFLFPILIAVLIASVVITVLVALPAFLLMRYMGWLQWGYACIAGMLAGLLVAQFLGGGKADHLVAMGGAIGLSMWWVGIFRNPQFPGVSIRIPWSMAALLPFVALWAWYRL